MINVKYILHLIICCFFNLYVIFIILVLYSDKIINLKKKSIHKLIEVCKNDYLLEQSQVKLKIVNFNNLILFDNLNFCFVVLFSFL